MGRENFSRIGEVVTSLQRDLVCLRQFRTLRKLCANPVQRVFHRAVVEPVEHAERKEVFRPINFLTREFDVALEGIHVERRDRQLVNAITGERIVFQRIRRIVRVLQVLSGKAVGVDDERATLFQISKIDFQRGRIHGHEDIRLVAGGLDVLAGEVQLESADPGQAAGWGANLRGEVRQRRDVVADHSRRVCKLRARQLHTVARVTREANGYGLDFFVVLFGLCDRRFYNSAHLIVVKPFRN